MRAKNNSDLFLKNVSKIGKKFLFSFELSFECKCYTYDCASISRKITCENDFTEKLQKNFFSSESKDFSNNITHIYTNTNGLIVIAYILVL